MCASGRVLQHQEKIMAKRREKSPRRSAVLDPDAAGIDIGAEEIYVAVPPARAEEGVRWFSSFTGELRALADWLIHCRIRTVAMESTGCIGFRCLSCLRNAVLRCIWSTPIT